MTHHERIHLEVLVEDVVNAHISATKVERQRREAEVKFKAYLDSLESSDPPPTSLSAMNESDPLLKAVIALLRTSGSIIEATQIAGCADLEQQIAAAYRVDIDQLMKDGAA